MLFNCRSSLRKIEWRERIKTAQSFELICEYIPEIAQAHVLVCIENLLSQITVGSNKENGREEKKHIIHLRITRRCLNSILIGCIRRIFPFLLK